MSLVCSWMELGPAGLLQWCHCVCLCIAGLLCLLLGLGIVILNSLQPEKLKLIFSLDKSSKEEMWDKSCLPAEPSCSAQDELMVPLGELCHVTATKL